jgi:KaiC/GvpD/RAD55 family RecA-like ATPase
MLKKELVERSPVRILEKSTNGGVGAGNIGVIASRKGIGKTAVLVQIAMDKLLQGEHVIHVSFTAHTDYVISWYEDIFEEIARKKKLEDAAEAHEDLIRNRVLMNFNQDGVTSEQILRSLRAMIVDGGFKADALIIDGFDFSKSSMERIAGVKRFAEELGLEVWYSCNVESGEGATDKRGVPRLLQEFIDAIAVLITLEPKAEYIQFTVIKDHDVFNPSDLRLKLDSKTLLIAEK